MTDGTPRTKSLVGEAKHRVAGQLPEDEHDYTADWVYETAIEVGLNAARDGGLRPEVQAEIDAFRDKLWRRHQATAAAQSSLLQRVREFVDAHARNGSKTGRADYTKIMRLDSLEPLRLALDEYDRVRAKGDRDD